MPEPVLTGVSPVIALVGMPGSGKSTVGKVVAQRLGIPFGDSDAAVEARAGCTIAELFHRAGEEVFRRLESETLADLVSIPGVVATGGGAVLNPENRELLRSKTHCVYLQVPTEMLIARLRNSRTRPLFLSGDVRQKVVALLAERQALYRETAKAVVATAGLSLNRIADAVVGTLTTMQENSSKSR